MNILKTKIDTILFQRNLTRYKLSKLIDITEATLCQMTTGKINFSENVITKLLPILEVSKEEFTAWILADKYSQESIQTAINELENRQDNQSLILTQNIDKILVNKGMSRTALSKLINHNQSSINKIIIGKESMSKTVILKIAPIFEVRESVIQGWILADGYEYV